MKDGLFELAREKRKSVIPAVNHYSHIHSYYEIYYLISGEVKYFIDTSVFSLKSGDIVTIPKNTLHKTVYSVNRRYERLLLNFDENILNSREQSLLSDLSVRLISIPSVNKRKVEEVLLKMEEEYLSSGEGSDFLLKAYLTQLLVFLKRQMKMNMDLPENDNTSNKLINDCAKYISDNCHLDITLPSMAKMATMSESYFSREFKKNTGFGFNEYLTINRIIKADQLLKTTTLPITAIATKCGFNDSNYFAAVFKKEKGITPHKYRKLNSIQ